MRALKFVRLVPQENKTFFPCCCYSVGIIHRKLNFSVCETCSPFVCRTTLWEKTDDECTHVDWYIHSVSMGFLKREEYLQSRLGEEVKKTIEAKKKSEMFAAAKKRRKVVCIVPLL